MILTKNHETHYQTKFRTWGFQMANKKTLYRCIKKKRGKKNQDSCCLYTIKSITNKSCLQMGRKKKILRRKLSISKMIEFMQEVHKLVPRIEWGHYPASVMVWWGGITFLHFCEKGIKTAVRNDQRDILTNNMHQLQQTLYRKNQQKIQHKF